MTQSRAKSPSSTTQPTWQQTIAPFAIGGFSGSVATTCLQPIDMIKVRVQLHGEGTRGTNSATSSLALARQIIAEGSIFSLYNGLSAAYLRQFTYTTLRIGFFDIFLNTLQDRANRQSRQIDFTERAIASLCGGGLAAWICTPVEVALVRMQSDGLRPLGQRNNYRSAIHALIDVGKREGIAGLWRGSTPTTVRAMATNFGQLAFFAESKAQLKRRSDLKDQSQTMVASVIAGFFAAFFSLPFDFIKTRLQRTGETTSGSHQYKGMLDCAVQVARTEGPLRFYRGFGLYVLRIAPHSIITMIAADNLRFWISGEGF